MKKLSILFVGLLITFLSLWAVKAKTPAERPDAYLYGVDDADGAWWLTVSTGSSSDMAAEGEVDPELPLNYIPLLGYTETYMVIGDDGSIEGYRQRTKQDDGSWLWQTVDPNIPEHYEAVSGLENVYRVTEKDGRVHYLKYVRNEDNTFYFIEVDENGVPLENNDSENQREPTENSHKTEKDTPSTSNPQMPSLPEKTDPTENDVTVHTPEIVQNPSADGGYIETETIYDTKISGNWKITYQTVVTRTYDAAGQLLRTKKDGPIEISKKLLINGTEEKAPDRGKIAATLDQEYQRVTSGLTLNPDLAQAVLTLLNTERQAEHLPALRMNMDSDSYKLACIKAADMAIYNHADFDSPMYGTIAELLSRYQIASDGPSETLWKTTADRLSLIHI